MERVVVVKNNKCALFTGPTLLYTYMYNLNMTLFLSHPHTLTPSHPPHAQIVPSSATDLQDYTYYFVPAPWLTMKLMRLLPCFDIPSNNMCVYYLHLTFLFKLPHTLTPSPCTDRILSSSSDLQDYTYYSPPRSRGGFHKVHVS